MRILLVSYFFPPYNSIGSVRVGKFARYLTELGHSVGVVAAQAPALEQQDASLPVQIDPSQVAYTPWWDVNATVRRLAGLAQRIKAGPRAGSASTSASLTPSLDAMPPAMRSLAKLYLSIVNVPDAFWGWQPYAFRSGRAIAQRHRPDVVLASGPPFSAFQVAARLSRAVGVPWVADFRDLWADKQPYPFAEWRRKVDLVLERRAMRSASGFVTVSAPMIKQLSRRYPGLSHELVFNGFDPEDYSPGTGPDPDLPLIVRYTGTLFYVGNNDPSILFRALNLLGEHRKQVRVEFVLRDFAPRLQQMADEAGVGECVTVVPPVSYRRSLELQQRSDVLLLIVPGRGDPAWDGVFGAKFFEYCGAGRPILAIATANNVAAATVRSLGLGLATTDPSEIAGWLTERILAKASGDNTGLESERVRAFTRRAQTERLEAFLRTRVTASGTR